MKRRLRDIAHKEMSKAVHKIDMKENARARATLKEISTLERRMRWFQHGVEKDLHSNLWWWVACLECKGEVQKVSSRLYEEAWEDMLTNGTLVHGRRKDEEAMWRMKDEGCRMKVGLFCFSLSHDLVASHFIF